MALTVTHSKVSSVPDGTDTSVVRPSDWNANHAITGVADVSQIPDLTLEKIPDAWVKKSVRCATTANITLSATQTIDGIAVVAGDRVLVKDQTTASQNGIYVVAAGAWARSADADTISELAGACVNVDSGTVNGGFRFDTDLKVTDTLGTTSVVWARVFDALDADTANTANKLVMRDASGNFSAGTVTAALSGNASTATKLATARTINGTSFDGSANVTVTANTPNALTFNNGGAGAASGSTFNGGAAVTISHNSIGAAPLASPTFTGTPAAPTAAAGTNTTQLATTAYVTAAVAALIPSGTVALFAQAAAPTGWTQITTDTATNRMLRVVNTAGGGIGGSHSPILNNVVPSHTHGFTTGTESADHSHSGNTSYVSNDHSHNQGGVVHANDLNMGWGFYPVGTDDFDSSATSPWNTGGISANHYHSFTSGGRSAAHTHSGTTDNGSSQTNWTPRYVDILMCSKN